MKRVASTSSEARRKLDRFRALRNDPAATRSFALEVLSGESNPEVLTAAIRALAANIHPEDHDSLREVFDYFAQDGKRRDPGGFVRVEVLNALWHLRNSSDIPLALAAASTEEYTLQGNGAQLRAAGLALLGVLDAPSAVLRAAEILGNGDADRMTAEPALTAIRLLAAEGELTSIALYVHASWRSGPADVVAEALRALAPLPPVSLSRLLEHAVQSTDEVRLLGLCDYLVTAPEDGVVTRATAELFRRTASDEIYSYLAAAVVASRKAVLLDAFLECVKSGATASQRKIALEALQHAAPSPAVTQARASLAN